MGSMNSRKTSNFNYTDETNGIAWQSFRSVAPIFNVIEVIIRVRVLLCLHNTKSISNVWGKTVQIRNKSADLFAVDRDIRYILWNAI